ncbi:MAG: LytTR family transcriptional regulator [Cellulosilyticum sp.]|nr:LytTR family transcriptional regulator [Cellulosilyticum sp.]
MRVRLEEDLSQAELEVLIRYSHFNQTVQKLKTLIASVDRTIACSFKGHQLRINASDIYYIESVDKRSFIYGENTVYESPLRLYQLLEELSDVGFVQVSKSCIVNINVLVCIKPLLNSRLEATLRNGECIYVTRKYVPIIRKKLERW